jgi:hypothetical protein
VSMADFHAGLRSEDLQRVSVAFAAARDPRRQALYGVSGRQRRTKATPPGHFVQRAKEAALFKAYPTQ